MTYDNGRKFLDTFQNSRWYSEILRLLDLAESHDSLEATFGERLDRLNIPHRKRTSAQVLIDALLQDIEDDREQSLEVTDKHNGLI